MKQYIREMNVMIKFWTYQNILTLEELVRQGIYYPDFNKTCINKHQRFAYNHILVVYKALHPDINNINGLVFGITEYDFKPILNLNDYENTISNFGASGTYCAKDEYYLLELELDMDEDKIMPIDFYKFSDLIYYTGIEIGTKQLDGINFDSEIVKGDLFKPNGINNTYELKQSHLPYIHKSMIKNIYPSIGYTLSSNIVYKKEYSKCSKLEYYKDKLL
jgi:hypothetical protein